MKSHRRIRIIQTDDDIIYNSDKTILIRCPINKSGEIVIPDGVQTIGDNAFYKCNIDSVIIPDSVTDIEPFAFKESEIQYCKFGKGMTYIGIGMFYWCQKLGDVKIPSNIKIIRQEAFSGAMCQSIELENGIERIEKMHWQLIIGMICQSHYQNHYGMLISVLYQLSEISVSVL